MSNSNHINNMLTNGIRYLKRGLESFSQNNLDFALTDFYCGLEIIIKSLVFQEDWRLLFSEPGDANQTQLDRGTAKTIGIDQAVKRLDVLAQKPISSEIQAAFNRIRKHRNQLMHFYLPNMENPSVKQKIAADLSCGWRALRLLRDDNRFTVVFSKNSSAYDEIDAQLLILTNYLKQAEIIIHQENPDVSFSACDACGMKTAQNGRQCLLCGYHNISHRELSQGAENIPMLNCPSCGGNSTVVATENGSRCKCCGAVHGHFLQCEYCYEWWLEDELSTIHDCSYPTGCENCDGNLSHQFFKND